ncbi:MAG: beta-lactam binding protein AmpH [Paenibacillaceae bacterium]|jgi:hypothetical protein|nr:beta-lactam binding protein AmpH [Paenibacillaceae bacterium]
MAAFAPSTKLTINGSKWNLNGQPTYRGTAIEGQLLNVRMVNCIFEDAARADFDPNSNTQRFIAAIPKYAACGVRLFTVGLQGGLPGYEGAVNTAFEPDGSLKPGYMQRLGRVIEACDAEGVAVLVSLFYQRQDQHLQDEQAIRKAIAETADWLVRQGYTNVAIEIANEFDHRGFTHAILRDPGGMAGLIRLAQGCVSGRIPVSASSLGHGRLAREVAEAGDFVTPHFNDTPVELYAERIAALKPYGKPVLCNEDDKTGVVGAAALRTSVAADCSWGYMHLQHNQAYPFHYDGPDDDPQVYEEMRRLSTER